MHTASLGPHKDVVFVSASNSSGAVRHRAEQVASFWQRATYMRTQCLQSPICARFPWACAENGKLGDGLVVVHVKFACFNLLRDLPAARHVLDPCDLRCHDSTSIKSVGNFSGMLGYSLAKTIIEKSSCGARQTWTIPMHSTAATGCKTLSDASRAATLRKLPIRVVGGRCTSALLRPPLRILIMGWTPASKKYRQMWEAWSQRWCAADDAAIQIEWECDHIAANLMVKPGSPCRAPERRHQQNAPRLFGPDFDRFGRAFVTMPCNMLHCYNDSFAVAVAYRELPLNDRFASVLQSDGAEKGAHRLVSPMSIGLPTIGQLSHAAMREFTIEAESRGTLVGANETLANTAAEAIAKVQELLSNADRWLAAHHAALRATYPLTAKEVSKRYDAMAEGVLASGAGPLSGTLLQGGFQQLVLKHLTEADHVAFLKAVGVSVSTLLNDERWRNLGEEQVRALRGNAKIVATELNALGLHALRALLAGRITRHVQERHGPHPWLDALMSEGVVVQSLQRSPGVLKPQGKPRLPDHVSIRLASLLDTLRSRPSCTVAAGVGFTKWEQVRAPPLDRQLWMHVDTFHPTYKVWIFRNTSHADEPFHYLRGSHVNTDNKLRWLFQRTRHLLNASAMPTAENYPAGAYSEATHGFEASLRVIGFDPYAPASHLSALATYGYQSATPIISNLPVLVVADTSGFHYRGIRSSPQASREQAVLEIPRSWLECEEVADCFRGCIPRPRSPLYLSTAPV